MRILYITFVYNELAYLPDAIKYYNNQGCDIYIIDNYSNDGTYEWLIENNIKCNRFDTNESFDLTLLQKELTRVLRVEKPDWVVYGSADLYYVFNKTIKNTIMYAEKLGCNQISVPCYGALNTGEKFNTPLYKNYFYGKYYKDLEMISKYDKDIQMNGDNIIIPSIKTYNAPGIMVNYGACKPIAEQKIKLKRRQKAWDNGLSVRTGKHFKWGEAHNWAWNKEEYLNFHRCEHKEYFKKLYVENNKDEVYYDVLELFSNQLNKISKSKSIIDIACGHGKYSIIAAKKGFKTYAIDARNSRVPIKSFNELGIEFKLVNIEDIQKIDQDVCLLFGIFYHFDLGQQLDLINKIQSKIVHIHTLIYNEYSKNTFDLRNETKIGNLKFAIYKEGNNREARYKASMNNYFSIWHTEDSLKNMFLNNGFKTFNKIKDITDRSGYYIATK